MGEEQWLRTARAVGEVWENGICLVLQAQNQGGRVN